MFSETNFFIFYPQMLIPTSPPSLMELPRGYTAKPHPSTGSICTLLYSTSQVVILLYERFNIKIDSLAYMQFDLIWLAFEEFPQTFHCADGSGAGSLDFLFIRAGIMKVCHLINFNSLARNLRIMHIGCQAIDKFCPFGCKDFDRNKTCSLLL